MLKNFVALALLAGGPAMAAPTLDVDNLITGPVLGGFFSGQPGPNLPRTILYQTFTATQSGMLDSIDLYANAQGSGNVYVKVFAGRNQTTPGTVLLGSVAKAAADLALTGVYKFDFAGQGIAIVAGQTYTFSQSADPCVANVCTTFNNQTNLQDGSTSGGYAGGALTIGSNGVPSSPDNADLNFRTFVNVAAVPEPASWAMMLAGFGLAGAALRRRTASPLLVGTDVL